MACIVKNVVRLAVVAGTGLAIVGIPAALIAGPERVGAVLGQARQAVNHSIDSIVGDPAALRAQLKSLEAQYPERIAEVRADLTELDHQLSQMKREASVSRKVVELAQADLSELGSVIAKAEQVRAENDGFAIVRVRLDERVLDLDQGYAESNRISKLRDAHAGRVGSIERDVSLLGQQRERLSSVLSQLENEQSELQDQLWQIEQQVDTIARNERIIELLEERDNHIERLGRYESKTLDHVTGKILSKLAEQEQRLAALAGQTDENDYIEQAEYELDVMMRAGKAMGVTSPAKVIQILPPVIEVSPDAEPIFIDRAGKGEPVARRD